MATRMSRLVLINALIFAVLASAVGLAYYGYSYTSEVSTREREIVVDTMRELAEEKVIGIESQMVDADNKLFGAIQLDPLSDLQTVQKTQGAAVESIFVLDDRLHLVLSGYVSSRVPRENAIAFRDYFLSKILPSLPLRRLEPDRRGHVHGTWDGKPYLFSFEKRVEGDKTYYIVLEADLAHLVGTVFPVYFSTSSPRLYQVVDDSGRLVFGFPFTDESSGVVVEQPFVDTVDKWTLRVAQRDEGNAASRGQRRIMDFALIGTALAVIVAGLAILALAIRRERRANALKSDFISNVSHELKTPLSIISMFGEMLALGRTKSPAQTTEYAEIIWRESVRLARLIDNVLDFAKIERGVDAYEFTDGDVGDVVTRAIELSQHRLAKAEMTVEADLEPDLPRVRLDPNAFTLAVLNLIDNGIKYAASGQKLAIALRRDGDRVVLAIRDWGPGIEPEEHGHIFERFYRARAVRLKPIRGSGIGLALVEHIVMAHGGGVTVSSEPGAGATFTLWLPVPPPPKGEGTATRGRTAS
jgi:two-component system, OmpR family, phosphate regulon sensor histidine kinase PhoR